MLGANVGTVPNDDLTRLALWNYVMYRTFNHIRCSPAGRCSQDCIEGIMRQYLLDAVRGDDKATSFVGKVGMPGLRHYDFSFDDLEDF